MAAVAKEEQWRWQCVSEESLLLHDDLVKLADHIPLPAGVALRSGGSNSEADYGLPLLDGKSPQELATIIHSECAARSSTFSSLMEYRLNALRCLWAALMKTYSKDTTSKKGEESDQPKPSQNSEQFSSRISLLLIFPTLRSLSRLDPQLSQDTATILLQTLQDCEPVSLSKEHVDCIAGLESLLCSWIASAEKEEAAEKQLKVATSALVALTVAVGTGSMLLRTVDTLQSLLSTRPSLELMSPAVLHKLLKGHVVQEEPSALVAGGHLLSWDYDTQHVEEDKDNGVMCHSIAFDGQFVYVASSNGKKILKIGTGLEGTLRSYVYTHTPTDGGWLVYCQDKLFMRRMAADNETDEEAFCVEMDRCNLKMKGGVTGRGLVEEPHTTVHLMSDGLRLYWLYALKVIEQTAHPILPDEKIKRHAVYLQTLLMKEGEAGLTVVPCGERLLIQRGMEDKSTEVMKSLMRSGGSYTSPALSSLLGGGSGGNKEDIGTSMGVSLKQIQSCACYCSGSSLVLIVPPPPANSRSLFSSSSASSSKALAVSHCYSLSSGQFITQNDLSSSPQLHCALNRGGSTQTNAACYDSINHCVWTVSDDWVDVWSCAGRVRPAAHLLAVRMNHDSVSSLLPSPSLQDTAITLRDTIDFLLRHSGMESCRLVPSQAFFHPVEHSLYLSFLTNVLSILQCSVEEKSWNNVLANIITLQAVLPGFISSPKHQKDSQLAVLLGSFRDLVWKLVVMEECPPTLLKEIRHLICKNSHQLLIEREGGEDTLLSTPSLAPLRHDLLLETVRQLRQSGDHTHQLLKAMSPLVSCSLTSDSLDTLRSVMEEEDLLSVTAMLPVFSPSLQCATAFLSSALRQLACCPQEDESAMEEARIDLITTCQQLTVFEACRETLKLLLHQASSLPPVTESDEETLDKRHSRLAAMERACKSTAVGCLLPPLLALAGDQQLGSLSLTNTLLESLSPLEKLVAEICSLLYPSQQKVSIPAPWASGRLIETIHPVRDNYKFKEIISFPGARHLFLKFDSRCSSQYDYDKVLVYAGDSSKSPKVAEYGGNTHGFGSRSVLGKGWPKDLVKIDGDTVTIMFEMKSGREHSTPDKAMWGFACTIRPQELAEDGSNGLPFLLDLLLSLSSVNCSLIGQLFTGAPPTKQELSCEAVMESALLQRCVWHEENVRVLPIEPLPSVVQKLRAKAGQVQPTLRPSIKELLRVDELEEVIVSVCLKHHGVDSPLVLLRGEKVDPSKQQLLQNLFAYINGLERRLQALAELEARWKGEVVEMAAERMSVPEAFFFDLLQQESSYKSFELLCCLKSVQLSSGDLFTAAKLLQELLERDIERARSSPSSDEDMYVQTGVLVKGVIERARLLLHVRIAPQLNDDMPPVMSRSVSTPASVSESRKQHMLRRQRSMGAGSQAVLVDVPSDTTQQTLLDEIFLFIGSKPEEAVSTEVFLAAAHNQRERGTNRVKALEHLHRVLTSRHHLGFAVKHILACVSPVLLHGPQVKDIVCSGLVQPVRDAFATVMQSVAKLASQQPVACINTIALLCTVPYTRDEETCLVRSGLVKLLDKLCCLSDLPKDPALPEDGEEQAEDEEEQEEAVHRVIALAWAAFQVLADRCVSWEMKSNGFISSGLAQQVSLLLTNHLSRAMESLAISETGASETLQEALSMLLGLARSHMGRTILSQPTCVSKLLLLLTDQRPSPKLVLIVLQLCRVALPLMSIEDCNKVTIPHHPTLFSSPSNGNHMATSTITLLMAKLAEYIVPITSPVPVKTKPVHEVTPTDDTSSSSHSQEELDESGQAAVVLYRRDNEGAADLLHLLLNQDTRQLGHRMESVLQLDHTLHEDGKVEVFTDSYRSCQRRALRWANIGFTVSIEPPSGAVGRSSSTEIDRKKAKIEAACRKKNLELLKTDPPRPFLSGMVAYSLASEIVGLLNGLLAEEEAVLVWRDAISAVLDSSLTAIPSLIPQLTDYCNEVQSSITSSSPLPSPGDLLSSACLANATFAALGGFKASIQPGMLVTILGNGIAKDCQGTVASISERRGIANIVFEDDDLCFTPNKIFEVSLSRLSPPEVGSLPVQQLELQESICAAIKSVLSSSSLSCKTTLSQVDASVPAMGLCRLFAELRTRVALSLSHHSQQAGLRERLLNCCNTDQLLKQAQSCDPGQRLSVVEAHCVTLRMLYRDSSRPPPPVVESQLIEPRRFYWDVSRVWPSVHSCCFSHHLSCVTYQGPSTTTTSSVAAGEDAQNSPRGVLIITTAPIPDKAPSFYWELEVCHLDTSSNASHLTLGYCPEPQKPAEGQQWSYPEETCLLRSNGRGCQVRGEDRMQWEKIAFDNHLVNGDVVGCGWVRGEAADGKGTVYFTRNGTCHPTKFTGVPGKLYPFVHLQKKSTRVRSNFGETQFWYAEGQAHRLAANIPDGDSEEEIAAIFRLLPFADCDYGDIDGEQPKREEKPPEEVKEEQPQEETAAPSNGGTPSHKLQPPSPGDSYQMATSLLHALETSYANMLECGPLVRPGGWDRGDEPEEEETESSLPQEEDLHSLLVKAWETKVFPIIQRRFRNDQERKSGLEQIRGALQLGMETIAQETVEFLYEENGGLPRDLHLPTMDDVKADLDKFTISRVKKGQVVVVRKDLAYARCGVRAMQKTLGLTGVVLGVDKPNNLVQVECYLSNEGALVRFWFPVLDLERPPKGFRKPAALKGVESTHIIVHRELLSCEAALFSIYCRSALLSLHPPSSSSTSPNGWVTQFSLLANQCFSQPSVEGHSYTSSPLLATSLHSSLLSVMPSPHSSFFNDCSIIEDEVIAGLTAHSTALHHLANGVCSGLTSSPLSFGLTSFSVADTKETMDITSPTSAFLVVTCPEEKLKASYGAQYKFPWAKVFCSRGVNGKAGRMALQEVARYPSQLSSQQYCGPVLPSLFLPTSSCHLRLGGCSPIPGRQLNILGLSPSLPIALVFASTLSTVTCRLASPVSKGSPSPEHLRALQTCLNSLSSLLVQMDTPPVLKEKLFQCISGILWTLHSSSSMPSLPAELTASLHQELQKLYDLETGGNGSPTEHRPRSRQSPLPSSGASKSVGMFSTYLQSLTELVIAINMCCSPPSPASPVPIDAPLSDTTVTKRKRSRKRKDWLVYAERASSLLIHLHQGTALPCGFYNCFYKSLPVRPQSRLLVVTGINPSLELPAVQQLLTDLCSQHGGLDTDNLFVSFSIVEDRLVVKGAVLELCSLHKVSLVSEGLHGSLELQGDNKELAVVTVFDNLSCEEEEDGSAKILLREYLHNKLADSDGRLVELARSVLCEVFISHTASKEDSLLYLFVRGVSAGNRHQELLEQLTKLSQDGYLDWAEQQIKTDPVSVWKGLLAVGYDLHLVRCGFTPAEAIAQCQPSPDQDHALILHVDAQCRRHAITSSQLHSWDITITDTDLVSQDLALLQGLSLADLRLRFLQLKHINRQLSQLLPLVDMRCIHPLSLGSRMRHAAPLLFYDVKISFLHSVLNTVTRRSLDQPPPEIKMDPLETVAGVSTSATATQFCQAANQMLSVPSPRLCVPLASGGDPTYAFNVKLSGEEVHGTSGSFRHFLWQVVRELQSPVLPLLVPCPSSAAGINKGKHILAPRPMTYSEEKLLEFLGQLLGVAMRADVPMALDLLPCFWKSLKGDQLSLSDLQEADYLTYSFTQQLLEAKDQSSFNELVCGMGGQATDESRTARGLVFTRTTLAGEEEELCDNGSTRTVRYEDRHEYVTAVRHSRLRDLSCEDRMAAVRCGLGSVVPLQLLSILTPHDLDMRVCGLPIIDLNYLKRHTTYHVGLMETDKHIQYFWKALDSLSQEELRKFIKFACNQERIPFGHPCREGGESLTHVPPYPMKIAPPDGTDQPDSRFIRAETCMFLVKLPQYTSQEVMTERLRYAINCREDPLSG